MAEDRESGEAGEAELIASRTVYSGRVLDVAVDSVRMPNGHRAELEILRHRGAAAVVPLTAAGNVVLVRQLRWAAGGWLLEVPAGKLDGGEPPEETARRELVEETGFAAGRLDPLGWIWTTPGFTDERIWLWLARDLAPARQELEPDEVLSVVELPFERAVEMAVGGEIRDGKTVCALLRAAARLG